MNQDRYSFSASNNFLNFEFHSDGPNGKIRKVVKFDLQEIQGKVFFNLAFGDVNEETKEINDKVVSDNLDRAKILATVAATVLEVSERFPSVPILAEGSTKSRTRLYQMGISSSLDEIVAALEVYGLWLARGTLGAVSTKCELRCIPRLA